jgi:alpha-tubulin suppressor-like RCC1 family protein
MRSRRWLVLAVAVVLSLVGSGCQLRTWGNNTWGQLGNGTTTGSTAPGELTQTEWQQISTGASHSCGIRVDGTAWCWGSNYAGQLGDGSPNDGPGRSIPTQVGTATNWATITAAGLLHTCATRTDGTAWCWGGNTRGELGDGTTTNRSTPTQVGTATTWATISTGSGHTCATRTNGTAWCWGYNFYGQLGDGTITNRLTPTQVGTATSWATIDAGGYRHTCAIRTNGTAWCWGSNLYGQLGDGTTTDRSSCRSW